MSASRAEELGRALAAVRARVDAACAAAGRRASEVTLVTVTKYFPAADAAALARLGCLDLGESREQEATAKVAECARLLSVPPAAERRPRWHMLGSVQRNKARAIARWADSAHSVDSDRLTAALSKAATAALDAGERAAPLEVYLQVSLDGDPMRGGVPADELDALAELAAGAPGLRLAGLMAVPPIGADAAAAFARLAELGARVAARHEGATGISAGMSADLEQAIAHGSTCVRVGTAILGPRPITSQ